MSEIMHGCEVCHRVCLDNGLIKIEDITYQGRKEHFRFISAKNVLKR